VRTPGGGAGGPAGAAGGRPPPLGIAHELRVGGEARGQREASGLGGRPQLGHRRPRPFGVHVVGRHRGDAAPVVDAGVEQQAEVVAEVGRRLDVDLRRQHEPGHGHRPEVLVGRARRRRVHGGAGLRQEVLDDDLLHVAVAPPRGGNGLEGGEPVGPVLADAHQHARRERDGQLAGGLEGGQPPGRRLVRGPAVGVELGQGLDHHPLADGHGPEAGQLVAREGPGVGVGQEPGLVEHEPAHGGQVPDRVLVAVPVEPGPGGGVAQLGPLAEGEEGLGAAGVGAGAGDGEDLLRAEVRRGEVGGGLGEGAVAAAVPAQLGQGDEHLGRPRDPAAGGGVPDGAGSADQLVEGGGEQLPHRGTLAHESRDATR
jgi:hypothetical protein